MQVSSVSKSFSFLKVLQIPTMENGPKIAKKFYEELMHGIQVWFFSMILYVALHSMWRIFVKGYWVLVYEWKLYTSRAVHRHRTGVGSNSAAGPHS